MPRGAHLASTVDVRAVLRRRGGTRFPAKESSVTCGRWKRRRTLIEAEKAGEVFKKLRKDPRLRHPMNCSFALHLIGADPV